MLRLPVTVRFAGALATAHPPSTRRRCRPPPRRRRAAVARHPRRSLPRFRRSAPARRRYVASCRPAAGGRSSGFRANVPAADSRGGGHGPRHAGPAGAVLLC